MSERRQGGGASAEGPMTASGAHGSRQPGPDPLIGRTINGRYRIDAVIARGGMGKVFLAEQAPLGRVCALKVLSPRYDGEDDPEFRRRFFLEASTAAKLTHANTVTIFDYGKAEDAEIYYIAMEYIEGRTLSNVLQEVGHLAEDRVRHIAAQICRSLREAHGLGVVHRDLKPGNIMLSDKGDERDSVKVLDFGLVKDVTTGAQDHTQEGIFMGSPKYMAPEQILGLTMTPRADIYSLGIMLYEMLAGKVPYDRGAANIQTLMAHVNEPLPNMHSIFPGLVITPQMEAIVYRCLEKDPARRYASMSALLLAIKGVAADGSIETSGAYPSPRIETSGAYASPRIVTPAPAPVPVPPTSEKTVLVRRDTEPGSKKKLILAAVFALIMVGGGIGAVVHFVSEKRAAVATAATTTSPPQPTPVETSAAKAAAPSAAKAAAGGPGGAVGAKAGPRVIHVESEPPGASVTEESKELCSSTPCDVILEGDSATKEHRFTVEKKGFIPKPLSVDPRAESISVALVAMETAPVPQPARRKRDPQKGDPSYKSDPYKPDPYQ